MIKTCNILITFLSLTFIVDAQTFDPILASKLQNNIDSIRIANNLKGISACVIYPKKYKVDIADELIVELTKIPSLNYELL